MKTIVLICVAALNTACGTLVTRLKPDHFGPPPFEALALDCGVIVGTLKDPEISLVIPLTLISLPIDAAFDLIFLPVDLATWPCGWKKELLLPDI
jgi:hypothetical protein